MTDVTVATEAPIAIEPAVAAFTTGAALASLPIEALQDVEMKVEVVLGHARLRLQELLDIRTGQVIELDRTRNSPVEVLVNGTLFARGEIVVIDETHLGVRIGEVVTVETSPRGPLSMALSASLLGATKAAATVPDVSVGHLLGHTVLALVVIVGGIWGVQKIWTRNRAKASAKPGRAASALTVISRQTLGKDHQLAVVRWGDREVLVGISGSNISFFDDSAGSPMPGHHDVLANASAPSAETLSTNVAPGRSPFAAALSTVMSPRPKAKTSSTPSMALPMLERLRDLTERS